jgi:glycosyltransferase involved in cell wall biosynthesis
MKKDKVAIIGTVGIPARYGGFETLTEHLVKNLSSKYNFTVYCSKNKYSKEERTSSYQGATLKYIPLNANGIQSILYDTISILHALSKNDVLIVLGVAGAWTLPFIRIFTNKKIIISIDGMEWKRDKWPLIAKLYLWWSEKIGIMYSHIDISDNESIQDYTAFRYKTLSRVIEYGADHAMYVEPTVKDLKKYSFLKNKYAVKVCRIEPENNVHLVLKAFNKHSKLNLVIVGNWDNSDYGIILKEMYKYVKNIRLLNPIYEQREIDLIRSNATLYIHGHSAGGTNPSLVEAMHLGLPIFAYNVSYNKTTTENKAIYFDSSENLISHLNNVPESKLQEIRVEMKAIASTRYTWDVIATKYELLISEVLSMNHKNSVFGDLQKLSPTILQQHQLSHLQNSIMFYENK